jgi:chemotaxis family two-component system sensor histidine kinase/response regulator PixL
MAINSDIRDQAYQFFIEEAPELLQVIEAGLLNLRQEHSIAKVHNLMRAAHSIKGGAASVGLDAIATLAHRLENIFKALYSETLEIDTDTESQLLQAYDCLRLPLMEQLVTGYFDPEQSLELANPIFAQLEARFGDALIYGDNYIPSSAELGVDMTKSIFEIDVAEGLERLTQVLAHPDDYEVVGELRAQAEVFAGFAELLNQPEFGAIAATTLCSLNTHPESALEITQLALADFQRVRQTVLTGSRDSIVDQEGVATQGLVGKEWQKFLLSPPDLLTNLGEISTTYPETSTTYPETSTTHPETSTTYPETSTTHPETSTTYPETSTTHPETSTTYPETSTTYPETSTTYPEISTIYPETSTTYPETSTTHPETSTTHPETSTTYPETELLNPIPSLEDIFSSSITPPDTSQKRQGSREQGAGGEKEWQGSREQGAGGEKESFNINLDILNSPTITPEEIDPDLLDSSLIEVDWIITEGAAKTPSLEEVFSSSITPPDPEAQFRIQESELGDETVWLTGIEPNIHVINQDEIPANHQQPNLETLEETIQHIGQIFDSLPLIQNSPTTSKLNPANSPAAKGGSLVPTGQKLNEIVPINQSTELTHPQDQELNADAIEIHKGVNPSRRNPEPVNSHLSVRVDITRLGRMNNLVGELAINRNGLSLQNDQLQGSVKDLLNRFTHVQNLVGDLRKLSDQMLVTPHRYNNETLPSSISQLGDLGHSRTDFDALELDSYGALYSKLQGLLEDMMQLEETVDDIVLFARATDQTLEQQRQMLTQLRDELMWARMLPLGEVLHRFPRMLRDLSTTYHKPVSLKLNGAGVLVDKAVLEKLYDPLLHLLRNAFDHGIEPPELRQKRGKPSQGEIEIRAYHRGSQTIIEVKDDGQGLNVERIGDLAVELGYLSPEQRRRASNSQLFELVFEPGFSTASQVSELSGRGVGLDVVRSQMRSLKGTISVTSSPGIGTTFTLRLPLTLTIAKLLVCFIGSSAIALPSDSIEEIVNPKAEQIKQTGPQQFLHWRGQLLPTYKLAELLHYTCPLPDTSPSRALFSVPAPANWAPPMLVLRQEQNLIALEIDRLVTEQELVIKPFGNAIAPPSCTYGCTILGDGSLIPVIDACVLLDQLIGKSPTTKTTKLASPPPPSPENSSGNQTTPTIKTQSVPTILVVDDAVALRRTLALTLERAGCRVLQARDGREAIAQLQPSSSVELVVCDIEMPNMNGFEFLSYRRQNPQISKIPVVMLTSRSNDKHRWLAMQLGATAYFTKPYLEQDFLRAIRQILGQELRESSVISH